MDNKAIEDKIKDINYNLASLNISVNSKNNPIMKESKSILSQPIKKVINREQYITILTFFKAMYKSLIALPIFVFLYFYIVKPKIVLKKNKTNNENILDMKKVKLYTTLITLVGYVCIYFYYKKVSY